MEDAKTAGFEAYLRELWDSFERSGSVSAYVLYNEVRKKADKDNREVKVKK